MRIIVVIIGAVVVLFVGMLVYRMVLSGPASAELSMPALPGINTVSAPSESKAERETEALEQYQQLEEQRGELTQELQTAPMERETEVLQQRQEEQQNQLPESIHNSVKPVQLNKMDY